MIKLHWERRQCFLSNITYPHWNLFTIYYVPEQRMEGTQVARQITISHVLERMVDYNYSQGNLMHCRLQDMTSRWALEWKLLKYAVCKPWKETGSGGCVCHTLRGCSSCDSPRDQPSAMSHDATSFQKISLAQGVFWQIRYPPAAPVQWQDQGTEILSWVWLVPGSVCLAWMETGVHFSSSEFLFPSCWSKFWIPASSLAQDWVPWLSS